MMSEALEEYVLTYTEAAYEESGKHAPMVFTASGGEFHDGNASHWADQKQPYFSSSAYSDNTKWETADVCICVSKETVTKEKGRVNAPLECWGCTNSPIYHADRFQRYINYPNNTEADIAERANQSIQEYAQYNSAIGGDRISQGIQY